MKASRWLGLVLLISGMGKAEGDIGALREAVRARQPALVTLLGGCKAKEGGDGVLRAAPNATPAERKLIAAENMDRDEVWSHVAKESRVDKERVIRLFAERAAMRNPQKPCESSGDACGRKAVSPESVARLLQFLKQGMIYGRDGQHKEAQQEFEQVRKIDANFPGVQKNLGSVFLRIKQFDDAEKAFAAELQSLDCLEKATDEKLAPFCYFVESDGAAAQVAECRERLKLLRGHTHYSRACLQALRGKHEEAIGELRKAIDAGFADKKAMTEDDDLASLRRLPEFKSLLP